MSNYIFFNPVLFCLILAFLVFVFTPSDDWASWYAEPVYTLANRVLDILRTGEMANEFGHAATSYLPLAAYHGHGRRRYVKCCVMDGDDGYTVFVAVRTIINRKTMHTSNVLCSKTRDIDGLVAALTEARQWASPVADKDLGTYDDTLRGDLLRQANIH